MSDFEKEKAAFNEWYNGNTDDSWFFVNNANSFDKIKRILFGFYGGYHSRDKEIARLRAEIERKDEVLMQISGWFYMPSLGDDAEGHLKAVQEIARQALQNKSDKDEN